MDSVDHAVEAAQLRDDSPSPAGKSASEQARVLTNTSVAVFSSQQVCLCVRSVCSVRMQASVSCVVSGNGELKALRSTEWTFMAVVIHAGRWQL